MKTNAHAPIRIVDSPSTIPLVARVKAGFPSPASDYVEEPIDLYAYLVKNRSATFFARIDGDSMEPILSHNDLIVVDRSITPRNGDVALCYLDGEFTVKTIEKTPTSLLLVPANPAYPRIQVREGSEATVWGVVTASIRRIRR